MSKTENSSSIEITIFRASTFLSRIQPKESAEYMSMAKMSIGSYFEKEGSRRIGCGLSFQELDLLLPKFVEVPHNHPEFMKKVSEYYQDIETKIPYGVGLKLEVGLIDNTKAIGEELSAKSKLEEAKINLPLNIGDYIKYKHAMNHPHVGKSKEEADSNAQKLFYIFNPEELRKKNKQGNEERDMALKIFLELKDNPNKIKMLLVVLGHNLKEYTGKNKLQLMEDALRKEATEKPKHFIDITSKKNLETEFFIQELVNHKIITNYSGKYQDPEATNPVNSLLASSLEEFIFYLQDEGNSKMYLTLKARLSEKVDETEIIIS